MDTITSRSEFQTAYTPYQPEVSQGTLTAIFEFQTAICELTGLAVSNALVYHAATACAEAVNMAVAHTGRRRVVVAGAVNPQSRMVMRAYASGVETEIVELPCPDGVTHVDAVREALEDAAALVVQQPNFFGAVEDLAALAEAAHGAGAAAHRLGRPDCARPAGRTRRGGRRHRRRRGPGARQLTRATAGRRSASWPAPRS